MIFLKTQIFSQNSKLSRHTNQPMIENSQLISNISVQFISYPVISWERWQSSRDGNQRPFFAEKHSFVSLFTSMSYNPINEKSLLQLEISNSLLCKEVLNKKLCNDKVHMAIFTRTGTEMANPVVLLRSTLYEVTSTGTWRTNEYM